ncbi:hypothetical protein B0H11DRAFT_2249218 [Mycena galericulata]|nr:hypothetical protein B0H11DRAFT_2249218 [Mycena galericulata]
MPKAVSRERRSRVRRTQKGSYNPSALPLPPLDEIARDRPLSFKLYRQMRVMEAAARKQAAEDALREKEAARGTGDSTEESREPEGVDRATRPRKRKHPRRARLLKRLSELRALAGAGSQHPSDSTDSTRTTDDLEEEVDLREALAMSKRVRKAVPAQPDKPSRRRNRKQPGKKPGKVGWVHGTKLTFFKSRVVEWTKAQEAGIKEISTFYTDITNLYLLKYGYDMKDDEDLDVDVPDPTDPKAQHPDAQKLSQEEADRRSQINASVRAKIGVWFRANAGDTVKEGSANIFKDLLDGGLDSGAVRPQKPQIEHFYSRKYYKTRIKARYDAEWLVQVQRAQDLELDEPSEVKVRGEVTRKVWEEETEDFQKEVRLALEKEHTQLLRAWEMGRAEEPSKTKEELNVALKNAGFYLQPLADGIRARFGMNCTIMLCGPVGDRGGAIEVRSVHAGLTRGLNPQKWHQFDRLGYRDAETSMVKFSERCFTAQDCRDRVVNTPDASGLGAAPPMSNPILESTRTDAAPHTKDGPHSAEGARTDGAPRIDDAPRNEDAPRTEGAPRTEDAPRSAEGARTDIAPRTDDTPRSAEGTRTDVAPRTDGAPRTEDAPRSAEGVRTDVAPRTDDTPRTDVAPRTDDTPRTDVTLRTDDTPHTNGGGLSFLRPQTPAPVAKAWRRPDMAKWSDELRRAHSAFALGEKWETDWADCVDKYLDFEAACGYQDEGPRIGGEGRPDEVAEWIRGGRKWFSPPSIKNLGRLGEKGSYANNWWLWWRSIQPPERQWFGGMLTAPTEMTFGKMTTMYGRNGFMQVMASLLWWGLQESRGGSLGKQTGWSQAVSDVRSMLECLVSSNELSAAPPKKRKRAAAVDGAEEESAGPSKRTRGGGKEKEKEQESPRRTRATAKRTVDTVARPRPRPRQIPKVSK